MLHQGIKNDIGARPAVKNIADNMQMVDNKRFDHTTYSFNKILGAVDVNNGRNDIFIVVLLIMDLVIGIEQLVDNICILRRQRLAHLGTRVFRCDEPADLNQAVQRQLIPFVKILHALAHFIQLLSGIVDQGCQPRAVVARHHVFKQGIHLFAHRPGGAVEDM